MRIPAILLFLSVGAAACSGATAPLPPPQPTGTAAPAGAAAAPSDEPDEAAADEAPPTLRLPRDLVPRAYRAELRIDPARPAFSGIIEIDGDIARATRVLWLNARGLEVDAATALVDGKQVPLAAESPGNELLSLRAAAPLPIGATTVQIHYHGTIDDRESMGIFRQSEKSDWYVFSKFEPIYARRVFPSIDEPDRKVPWQLTLEVPAAQTALSNTLPVEERPAADGWKRVVFAQTRPLPSYLVAFAVGPFEIVEAGKTKSGAPIRIIAPRGRAGDTRLAVDVIPKVLAYLEDWFDFPFPFDKLDLLPIPLTVGFGCMENPGLVTCAADYVLFDPAKTTPKDLLSLASLGAHELAHMWFGDIVTMAWWNDLWLNEGFATWIQDRATAEAMPVWNAEVAAIEGRRTALFADRLATARAVRQPIAARDDILNAFDGITYSKGAAVISMFERWLGPDVFRAGIRAYIKEHAYGNASTPDLIAALGNAAGRDVSALSGFVEQAGAPHLQVDLRCEAGRPPALAVSQDRYLPPGSAPASTEATHWTIPVCVAYDKDGARAETCTVVDGDASGATDTTSGGPAVSAEIPLEATACPRWVWPNATGAGYYHVSLTPAMVDGIVKTGWKALSANERGVFLGELNNMIHAGEVELATGLRLVPMMLAENNRAAVREAVGIAAREAVGIAPLDSMVSPAQRATYDAWIRQTFGALARKLGWIRRDRDAYDLEWMRREVVPLVARGGDPSLRKQARTLSARWRSLPRDTRQDILAAAVDDPAVFDRLYREVLTETDREMRRNLLLALASSRDPDRLRRALALVLDTRLDIRETAKMLFIPEHEPERSVAEQFLRDHLDEVLTRFPAESMKIGHAYFASIFTTACDAARRDEIATFVTDKFGSVPGGHRAVLQRIEAMDQCIAWRKLATPQLAQWLTAAGTGARKR